MDECKPLVLGFHPQIRVVTDTLMRALPFMLEFAFLWFGVLFCYAVMANLQLGWWFQAGLPHHCLLCRLIGRCRYMASGAER